MKPVPWGLWRLGRGWRAATTALAGETWPGPEGSNLSPDADVHGVSGLTVTLEDPGNSCKAVGVRAPQLFRPAVFKPKDSKRYRIGAEVGMWEKLAILGVILIFLGMALVFIGIFMSVLGKGYSEKLEGGGVIMIGPIPIVVATSPAIAVVLIALALVLMVIYYLLTKS